MASLKNDISEYASKNEIKIKANAAKGASGETRPREKRAENGNEGTENDCCPIHKYMGRKN